LVVGKGFLKFRHKRQCRTLGGQNDTTLYSKFMQQTLIVFTVLVIFLACNNFDTHKVTSNTQTEEQQTDTTKTRRQTLIKELKRLQQIVASNDKEKIAAIFEFPLSDTAFSICIDDSLYNEQYKANDNKTTKTMFLQYYKQIYPNIWLDQLNNLFRDIKIDSLLYKDTLEYDAYIETKPCYYSYQIEVINDSVSLSMNGKSNTDYKSKDTSEGDIAENSSEICEHSLWWVFRFDGQKLHFENISGAD
jgi:hypothetical protein